MKNYINSNIALKHNLMSYMLFKKSELEILDKIVSVCSDYPDANEVSDQARRQLQDWAESGEEIDAELVQKVILNLITQLNKITEKVRPNGMAWKIIDDPNGVDFGLLNENKDEV
jgi:hypothetical protein